MRPPWEEDEEPICGFADEVGDFLKPVLMPVHQVVSEQVADAGRVAAEGAAPVIRAEIDRALLEAQRKAAVALGYAIVGVGAMAAAVYYLKNSKVL